MIKTNNKGLLIVVSGPSGAGKDTICQKLIKDDSNIWMSVSMTTRKPRPLEKDGVDYFFVSSEEFENKINDNTFLEYASYNDNYYGTPKDKVEDAVNKVKSIIQSEKCRVDRIEDIYLGNKEELIHEILIDKNFENNY